jgi:hypothetical protein
MLNLHGFYMSSQTASLHYLVLRRQPTEELSGFAYLPDRQVMRFEQDENGSHRLISAVCPGNSAPNVRRLVSSTYLLPDSGGGQTQLVAWIISQEDYAMALGSLEACRLRDDVPLKAQLEDSRHLISGLKDDAPIQFIESLHEVEELFIRRSMEVRRSADGWAETVRFERGNQAGTSYAVSSGSTNLFQSEMDSPVQWQLNRYGELGGIGVQSGGLDSNGSAIVYSSGNSEDHLSTPYVTGPGTNTVAVFTLWVKPLGSDRSTATEILSRPDGWVLMAGWAELSPRQQVRLVIKQGLGTASLLDKVLLVAWPRRNLTK